MVEILLQEYEGKRESKPGELVKTYKVVKTWEVSNHMAFRFNLTGFDLIPLDKNRTPNLLIEWIQDNIANDYYTTQQHLKALKEAIELMKTMKHYFYLTRHENKVSIKIIQK